MEKFRYDLYVESDKYKKGSLKTDSFLIATYSTKKNQKWHVLF